MDDCKYLFLLSKEAGRCRWTKCGLMTKGCRVRLYVFLVTRFRFLFLWTGDSSHTKQRNTARWLRTSHTHTHHREELQQNRPGSLLQPIIQPDWVHRERQSASCRSCYVAGSPSKIHKRHGHSFLVTRNIQNKLTDLHLKIGEHLMWCFLKPFVSKVHKSFGKTCSCEKKIHCQTVFICIEKGDKVLYRTLQIIRYKTLINKTQ